MVVVYITCVVRVSLTLLLPPLIVHLIVVRVCVDRCYIAATAVATYCACGITVTDVVACALAVG